MGPNVARYSAPLKIGTDSEREGHHGVEVGAGIRSHEKNDRCHHQPRRCYLSTTPDRPMVERVHHTAAYTYKYEKEGADGFADQSAQLMGAVVELIHLPSLQ